MLEQEKPDVVHICTPHYLHAPLACLAMEHGCHVLTEKPMAIALADARRMLDTAAATGRTLGVIFQNRYNAGSQLHPPLPGQRRFGRGARGARAADMGPLTGILFPKRLERHLGKEGGGVIIDQATIRWT